MRTTTKTAIAALALGTVLGVGVVGCRRAPAGAAGVTDAKQLYHCPMHPSYVSDHPGQCPICKMDLVPMPASPVRGGGSAGAPSPAATTTAGGRRVLYYRSPMDPSVHSPVPRKDEMGMDFVPVYEDEVNGPVVAGRAMVAISPDRRQLLGVRSEPVSRRHLEHTIRTVGRVAMDERRVQHVHTKYEAYVEGLYVNFVGQQVRRGEPLAALYSPDVVATQQEYLLALRAQQQLQSSGVASVAQGGRDLLQAARQRLLFWDVSPRDVQALERTGKVSRTITLYAEHPGYVINKTAVHGMRVTPSDTLFDIADLSTLWILADVYESDLANVSVGMSAETSLPYQAGRSWSGTITYINPLVDPGTRTIKVRIEVPNRDTALKPDMFVDVRLRRDLGDQLFVPESAVLRAGERRIVFLDRGDGRLEPREVALGDRVEGGYAVLSGVAEGDRVVTSANFLIDSESSLKAALSAMATPAPSPSPAAAARAPAAPAISAAPARTAAPAAPRPKPAGRTVWICPMDTDVVSDKPGSCPKCGMDLVPQKAPAATPPHAHHD
jgi:multidrug efflux pump subunit AcrA (membrane-fusion protein)